MYCPLYTNKEKNEMNFQLIEVQIVNDFLPIPTIDELRLFIGRGAVRLPPPQAGISCVR